MRKLLLFALIGLISLLSANAQAQSKECLQPVDQQMFQQSLTELAETDFQEERMELVDKLIASYCLSTKQVKALIMQFDFEDIKLQIAEKAFNKTVDKANFLLIKEAFEFDESIAKLSLITQN